MSSFIKTFIVCLILCLGYFVYRFVGADSFSPSLNLSDNNPVFSDYKEKNYIQKQNPSIDEDTKTDDTNSDNDMQTPKEINKKHIHTCYFYSVSGKLIPIKREVEAPVTIENTIMLLLKGPLIAESKKGIYSEIPANVDLINVQRKDNSIIVNLSSNFGNGGGSESVENRLKQLATTVKPLSKGKKIYLYINGSEVEYLGGEGVFVKQPLE